MNTQSDPRNCSTCGNACADPADGSALCLSGTCDFTCDSGFSKCGTSCADTAADPSNCSTCGNVCPDDPNGTSRCTAGVCGISCDAGFSLCSGECVDTDVDRDHCGSCGNGCSGSELCVSGTCGTTCPLGETQCGGQCTNTGTDPLNCSSCGTVCPKPPNSTRTCVGAVCGFTCLANFADCDGNAGNGCEVNSLSDPTHCNSCTVACNSTNAMASCVAGACQVTCNPEFGDCDGDPSNGCECGLLNGCTMSTATDMTGQSQITVEFGSSIGHRYVPGCIVVSVGTEIVFDGNFNPHPMVGGTVAGGTAVPDATSPFWPEVTSGGSASFTLGTPGTFPYYCPAHFQLGMMSTIYVVP